MSWAINNLTAPDNYTTQATLDGLPNVRRATLDVTNQAIMLQVKRSLARPGIGRAAGGGGLSEGSATWGTEEYVPPGSKPILRQGIVGLRFRAAVTAAALAGSPQAQVTLVVPA